MKKTYNRRIEDTYDRFFRAIETFSSHHARIILRTQEPLISPELALDWLLFELEILRDYGMSTQAMIEMYREDDDDD